MGNLTCKVDRKTGDPKLTIYRINVYILSVPEVPEWFREYVLSIPDVECANDYYSQGCADDRFYVRVTGCNSIRAVRCYIQAFFCFNYESLSENWNTVYPNV